MIKFIYFDVGGVTILDFTASNKWAELEKELGIYDSKKFSKFWDKYEPELCTGRDTESLIPLIEKEFGVKIPSGYSLLMDGFIKRFESNKSIWQIINDFHKVYPVGLLTNMYPGMLSEIKKHGLLPNILWDVIVDSSVEKLRKPNPDIFVLAEQKSGFTGQEILFIDNTLKNIEAAKKFGWQTFLYNTKNTEESNNNLKEKIQEFRK